MATVSGVFALSLDVTDLPGSVMLCCTYQALTTLILLLYSIPTSHCLLDLGTILDLSALSLGQVWCTHILHSIRCIAFVNVCI